MGSVIMFGTASFFLFREDTVVFSGNGEHGVAAKLPDGYQKETYDDLYSTNGFNALLSDFISVNRSLPDIRHQE